MEDGETFSPVLKYEAMLVEKGGHGLTEEKVVLVFQTLDKIVPNLGVFTKIMKLCRDELFDAVYSEQYTSGAEGGEKKARYIQRVPHFTLLNRIYHERDEKNEQLAEKLEIVKKALFEKQQQLEEALETVAEYQQETGQLKENVRDLEKEVAGNQNEIQNLESTLEDERDQAEKREYEMECDVAELREELHDAKTQAVYLQQYKAGYDDLQAAFSDPPQTAMEDLMNEKITSVATKRAHLISNVDKAMQLEEQLLNVMNSNIDEYDNMLEDHKTELLQMTDTDHTNPELQDLQHLEIDTADQQLLVTEERFQKSIDDLNLELELLRQHQTLLLEQLQMIDQTKPAAGKKKKVEKDYIEPAASPVNEDGSTTGGVPSGDEDEEDTGEDPFVPHERIFSKYAAMMYTSSNQGKTYHEFKAAKFCVSCGEKTVLCPHKILREDEIFLIPPSSTHLKISRPKVRINKEIVNSILRDESSLGFTSMLSMSPDSKRIHSRLSVSADISPLAVSKTPGDIASTIGTSMSPISPVHEQYDLGRLYQDYKTRTDLERAVPRQLSMPRVLSVIEQFMAMLLWQDDYASSEDGLFSILDNFYRFMSERYIKADVAHLAAHDLLTSLATQSGNNKLIWLFTQVLVGNLDTCTFRYMLLMSDFIEEVEWREVEDFRSYAAVVYPFLDEDDLEAIQMGYTSFSENKISKTLVSDYFIFLIMKHREPMFIEMEKQLLNKPGTEIQYMTLEEFIESSDAILDVPNAHLQKRFFHEALLYLHSTAASPEGVPVLRLAQITSYLSLLSILPVVKETVADRVAAAREQASIESSRLPGFHKVSHEVLSPYRLLTLTETRNLGISVSRRLKCRHVREIKMAAS